VRGADVVGGEDGVDGCVGGGGFYVGSASLFAVYEAKDSDDVHAGFFGGFDGGDGGTSGGADVIDDDDVGSDAVEAFKAATGAVGLFGFADEEAVEYFVVVRGAVVVPMVVPCGGAGGVGDEGVGSHGESAGGFGGGEVLADKLEEEESGEAAAFSVEGGGAAVDVVVGLLAAGEGEVAELERKGRDQVEQFGSVIGWHGFLGGTPPVFLLQSLRNRNFRCGLTWYGLT